MKKISEPIVFFGSGPVAAESLSLLSHEFDIEAVVTRPRPDNHKDEPPVIAVSEQYNHRVFTVSDKAELDRLIAQRPFESRLGILIDFGVIVSQAAIDYFPLGIINSHFSLLPEWRGADPITFAVLSGQKRTGVSLMLLVKAMDEGPLLATSEYSLGPNITTPELTKGLIKLSFQLLAETVPKYVEGNVRPFSQSKTGLVTSYSRKLTKADGKINWGKPAEVLEREIRAYTGWPKSRCVLGGLEMIVTKAHVVNIKGKPGERVISEDNLPTVYCGNNALALDIVKPASKKEMSGAAFLAGYRHSFIKN
jgi:methionyl-tRNA formyltransferase